MFSLLEHKRQTEFWRDMWSILREPKHETPPGPTSFDQDRSPNTQPPQPLVDDASDET